MRLHRLHPCINLSKIRACATIKFWGLTQKSKFALSAASKVKIFLCTDAAFNLEKNIKIKIK